MTTDFETLITEAKQDDTLSSGTVPLHTGVKEYVEMDGKVLMYVRDNDQGRSLFLAIKAYDEVPHVFEVRYEDFIDAIGKMQFDIIMQNENDPYKALLSGGKDD